MISSVTFSTLFRDISAVSPPAVVWKTLSHHDPEFKSYLDGSFSRTHRALPVRQLDVGTGSEEVTFQIVGIHELNLPPLGKTIWQLARPNSLILSIGPMVGTIALLGHQQRTLSPLRTLSASVAVLLFHIAMNLFNDSGDHMRGRDRLRTHGGSRVIQNGWLAAHTVRRLAWLATGLSLICAIPSLDAALMGGQYLLAIVAVVVGLAALEFAFQKLGLKYRGWAEIMAFALTGPLLTSGLSLAATGRTDFSVVALGCLFGSMSLMYFHAVNFENIMADSQAQVRTWATRAGFDSSKKFFYFCAILSAFCFVGFLNFTGFEFLPSVAALVHLTGVSFLCARVASLASPLSSRLNGLRRQVLWATWLTALTLFMSLLWALLISP